MFFIAVNPSEARPLHRSEIYIIPFLYSPTGNEAGFISKKVPKCSRNPCSAVDVPSNISTSEISCLWLRVYYRKRVWVSFQSIAVLRLPLLLLLRSLILHYYFSSQNYYQNRNLDQGICTQSIPFHTYTYQIPLYTVSLVVSDIIPHPGLLYQSTL